MFRNVITIAGVARSGTSWLGELIDSSPDVAYRFQPIFSYAFKNAVSVDSERGDFERFFEGIYFSEDDFLLQRDKREAGLYPQFSKTASPSLLAWKEVRHLYILGRMLRVIENVKLVAIIRHPCAVINSWLRNPKEFPPGSNPLSEWRFGACKNEGKPENFYGYYKWREAANLFVDLAQQYPARVHVVDYANLIGRTSEAVQSIFDFCGMKVTEQTERFIRDSTSKHVDNAYAVYKSSAVGNAWREQLAPAIRDEIIADLTGTRLERFLS